jgi:hypothetical protein
MQSNIRLADSDVRERSSLSLPQGLAAAVLRQNSNKLLYCNYWIGLCKASTGNHPVQRGGSSSNNNSSTT